MLKIEIPHVELQFGKENIRKTLREAAMTVMREARSLTKNPNGGGRAYSTPTSMSKGVHYASAPGEPPAMLTGELNRSMSMKSRSGGESITITDSAYYSKFLETGATGGGGTNQKGGRGRRNVKAKKNQPKPTPSTSRVMEPRPFLTRALEDNRADIEQKIQEAVKADLGLKRS